MSEREEVAIAEIADEIINTYTEAGIHGWVITLGGRVYSVGGKFVFDSREQAIKNFYNSLNWRVKSRFINKTSDNSTRSYWSNYYNDARSKAWKEFMKYIKANKGFDTVKV